MVRQAELRPFVTESASVTQLALHVVTQLARSNGIETGDAQRELLQLLVRFARSGDETVMRRVQQEMRRTRVSAEQVIDVYLPAAVKSIGTSWHEGDLDILQTSIACARLQTFLRELGRAWAADQCGNSNGARVLLVLPRGEQHTFGAMIAANQLRRLGVSVRIQLLPSAESVASVLGEQSFNGLFLSVSNETSLESCEELIKTIRQSPNHAVPIALGGGIVSVGHLAPTQARLASMTGADIVTGDVVEALDFCGLLRRSEAAA